VDLARSIGRQWNLARPSSLDSDPSIAVQPAEASDVCLSVVATSVDDLAEKLQLARSIVEGTSARHHDPRGIHFVVGGYAFEGRIAFLFPGQGSQYVNMLRDISLAYPDVRETIEKADITLSERLKKPLSRYIFPPPAFTSDVEKTQQAELTETDIAQAALGATDLAVYRLIRSFGVKPSMVAGHSYGEIVALAVAGCFDEKTLFALSEARGRFIREGANADAGTMAAIDAGATELRPILADLDVTMANLNAPKQTVISGTRAAIDAAVAKCAKAGLRPKLLPVACAFHSPLVGAAQLQLAALLRLTAVMPPTIPVYSNTTAGIYPDSPVDIIDLLSDHLVRPVEFVREINAMYDAGARIFAEVGPRSVLTGLVSRILTSRPHVALSFDQPGRPGIVQLLHGLAMLAAEGVNLNVDGLFSGRITKSLDLQNLVRDSTPKQLSPTTWMVNGGRATPPTAWKNVPYKDLKAGELVTDVSNTPANV
jgi:acyl transferase domain-containing protein